MTDKITPKIKAEVVAAVDGLFAVAERHFQQHMPRPVIQYNLNDRRIAGQAYLQANVLKLNPRYLLENYNDMMKQTVPHEVAHLVAHFVEPFKYPARKIVRNRRLRSLADLSISTVSKADYAKFRSHGSHWASIMKLFGRPADRCHDYEALEPSRKASKWKRVPYECDCKTHELTFTRHRRHAQHFSLTGRAAYYCKRCKGGLWPKGSARDLFRKEAAKTAKTAKVNKPGTLLKGWNPKPGTRGHTALTIYRDHKDYLKDSDIVNLIAKILKTNLGNARTYLNNCKKA